MPPDDKSGNAAAHAADVHELALDLNFVPTWAREPPTQNPYSQQAPAEIAERRPDRRPPGRNRDQRPAQGRREQPRRDRDKRGRSDGNRTGGRSAFPQRAPPFDRAPRRLPIEVAFLPDRDRLGTVARQLHASLHAYPLNYLASLFLAKPEYHSLKIEIRGQGDPRLFQCALTKAVFLSREAAVAHAVEKNVEKLFEIVETTVEPPAGNFVCVARCRLTGTLLGPPNYHGYNEKIQEVRRERFPQMSLDEYRNNVEMVRDPALIEQWKDQQRTQRVYKLRGGPEDAPPMKRAEAEAYVLKQHGAELVHATSRAIVPATVAREIESGPLREAIHAAWGRESRNFFTLMLALRPAFRRMRLYLFKANGETFVSAVQPRPLDVGHVVEPIQQMLRLLQEHPGCTRHQLVEWLRPGADPESPEAAESLSPLRWLIEKGHVIEFFNGTLSVPAPQPVPRAPTDAEAMKAPLPISASPPVPADLA